MKSMWFAYAMMWVSVSIAVSVGIYFTRNIHCLWFLIIPSLIGFTHKEGDKNKDNKDKED